jgi:hypothetical protein
MNKLHLLSLTLLLLATACKKDDDDTANPSGGGNNGGGGGGNIGADLITSWSPLVPYRDQVVTFTGGPFNTDLARTASPLGVNPLKCSLSPVHRSQHDQARTWIRPYRATTA